MSDEGLTLAKLLKARDALGEPTLFVPRPMMSMLEQLPRLDPAERLFGPQLGSYLGIRMFKAPEHLFRPPDKPLRSRPRRKWWRPMRKRVRAERVKLRQLTAVYGCRWLKSRKVPDRRGYSQNTCFMFNMNAIY